MTKMNTFEMTAGSVFNLQDFEQNKIKFKQRSFEDFIGTSFVLIDADLFLIWMNNFQLCFCFHLASCPVLPAVLIILRGECNNLLISSLLVSYQSIVSLVQFRIKVQKHWIGSISFQFLVVDGHTEQKNLQREIRAYIEHCPILDANSESFIFPASNCFDTAQEKPKGADFSIVGGLAGTPS